MAESEKTDLELQVSFEESDSDSSFEVIEDPENPRVSTIILFLGIFCFIFSTKICLHT